MTDTDNLSRMRGINHTEETSGRPPGRPMRQLEFHQAMDDFRHMFPETEIEIIEAVLRANNGMVDATIDQLLTMNIDTEGIDEDEDDLSDHILMSVERDVQQQQPSTQTSARRSSKETKATKKVLMSDSKSQSKDSEHCPPSYTEAVQSHLTSHHRSSSSRNRHRAGPGATLTNGHLTRPPLDTMQHLLDLGPDTAPSAASGGTTTPPTVSSSKSSHSHHTTSSHHHHHHHHNSSSTHHHHVPRSSNHHHRRRTTDASESSPHKSRPGRNLLATWPHLTNGQQEMSSNDTVTKSQRKGSMDNSDASPDHTSDKQSHRWRAGCKQSGASSKRPAYRNWNPPLLGTLPDDFLRICPPIPSHGPGRYGVKTHLHRTMSAVGPERPQLCPTTPSSTAIACLEASGQTSLSNKHRSSTHKPHRSLSFAGHTHQHKRSHTVHPSGLAQHEFTSDILQERLKENERRRRNTSDLDTDLAQYLEDERLAIMLQNSEFLQELRGDHVFMMTLEQDQQSADIETSKPEPPPQEPVSPPFGSGEDIGRFIEGYGDDKRETLDAFPFSQQLPPPVNEDVELRKKLRNMSRATRKQFAALARKFFLKRKKKTAQQILKESQAPSMANLLDEDDEEEDDDTTSDAYDQPDRTSSDFYNSSQHM